MERHLLLSQRTIDELKAVCQTTHRVPYQRLVKQAESYRNWLPPAEHPSKSITFIGTAVANLALAHRLSDRDEFLETLRNWLAVTIDYSHWGKERMPDQDLDAAWLLFGLGLAYNWTGAHLSTAERTALHDKLLLQGRRLYNFAVEADGKWWSSAYWQNHNWICYSGLAMAAYALQDQNPEARIWSQKSLDNFRIVFEVLPEDGSDYEGVVYWCYGVPWLMIYADLAAQQEGVDFYTTPFLQNTFYYRLYMSCPNLVDTANFGDCHDRRSAHSRAMYYWFAHHYQNGHAKWLAEHFEQTGEWEREAREGLLQPGLLSQAFLDFLWYDPFVEAKPIDDLPLSRSFSDLGLVGARTSWTPDATFFAFKCGVPLGRKGWSVAHDLLNNHNWDAISGGHLHPDENSFILVRHSDYLAIDDGYSKAKQTIQHNTVLIDGRGQYNEGTYHVAKGLGANWGAQLKTVHAGNGMVYVEGDAAGAYPPELEVDCFNRQVILWNRNQIFLYDHLASQKPRKFEWLMQTDVRAEIERTNCFTVRVGQSRLSMDFIAPDEIIAQNNEREIVAVPSSAEPDRILRRTQHTLAIYPRERQETVQFFIVLTIDDSADDPAQVERLNCTGGVVARISRKDQRTLVGFASGNRYWGAGNLFGTDASWLVAESDANGCVLRLAVGASTRTYVSDQLWCSASHPVCFDYGENGWHIQSVVPTWMSVRVPKGVSKIEINGTPIEREPQFEMVRLSLPGGESTIRFHKSQTA